MTVETIIKENTRFDRGGKPLEVAVPYDQFIDFIEEYGLDLTEEEREAIREHQKAELLGKPIKTYSSEEVKRELG